MEKRLLNEIEHGKFLAREGAGEVWNWESPAGKVRWQRRVKMLTSHLKASDTVLEIGCGTGYFTKEIVRTGAAITAIDISPELLDIARKDIQEKNVSFKIANAYALEFPAASFTSVLGSSVLHHLEIDKAISEFFRVLKPGGIICFTEPNMMNPQIALQKNIPYLKRRLGDSPDETAFFRWTLRQLLHNTGFTDIHIQPFDFLHPAIPQSLIGAISGIGNAIEKVPILKEIAGSLYITARKH
ncbi:MAG: class I SAM-dependent methyltransferase [Bacteroidetes bacterium]|nr:class I SAM-dependent methyltransferase [Bacteroidota bacterium]